MLLDPAQVAGHVGVHTWLVAVAATGTPADDASQDEPVLCGLVLTH